MKNLSWKRKLAAGFAALGLLSPAAVLAANLNTNLVVNPSFENVNTGDTGPFNSVRVLDWIDVDGDADDTFAYSYSSNYSGSPAPPNSGLYHFSGGFFTTAGDAVLTQSINVSSGASGNLISSGAAFYTLNAFFSSYLSQADASEVRVRFLDAGLGELASDEIGGAGFVGGLQPIGNANRDWGQDTRFGSVPIGTATVAVDVISDVGIENHDGYLDLVNFQVNDAITFPVLDVTVDRDAGSIVLTNATGGPVNLAGYSITSPGEGMNPSGWTSIADNSDADSGRSVDAVNIWTELTDPATFTDLSEADLVSGLGTTLAADQTVILGSADAWLANPIEDIVFQYVSDSIVVSGIVQYTGNNSLPFEVGDFDTNGDIDQLDWMVLRANQHTDLSGLGLVQAYLRGDLNADLRNDHTDFVLFQNVFDQANGVGAFAEMLQTVPEPGTSVLVLTAGIVLLSTRRRQRYCELVAP